MNRKQRIRQVTVWGEDKVREHLFARINPDVGRWKRMFWWMGVTLLIVAAMGPQIGTRLTEVERKGVDIVVALDISSSMKAEDVKPNRLEKAKLEISRLVSGLKGDRIGLILFAGTSHLYLPLTSDYDAAKLFVDAVDTDMIRTQGTALSEALKTAIRSFPEQEPKHKVLILVTDGEDHEGQALDVAYDAARTGIVIHSVGVGTAVGSLIPILDSQGNRTGYKKDRKGKPVTTSLNGAALREFASAGGGFYMQFDNRSGEVGDLVKAIDAMEKRTLKTHEYSRFEDRYQLFAAFAFLLFVGDAFISNRRKSEGAWHGRFV